jgi:hypothetical protein
MLVVQEIKRIQFNVSNICPQIINTYCCLVSGCGYSLKKVGSKM